MDPLPRVYFVTAKASIEGLGRKAAVKEDEAYHPELSAPPGLFTTHGSSSADD